MELFISTYHEKHPHKPGTNLQEIIGGFRSQKIETEVVEIALKKLINSGSVILNQNAYALKDFKIKLSKDTETAKSELLLIVESNSFGTPTPEEIAEMMSISKNEVYSLIQVLMKENKIIQINNGYYIFHKNWEKLLIFLKKYFDSNDEIEVSDFKEFVKTTRKYVIPLLEFLDSKDITRRNGNVRQKGNSL